MTIARSKQISLEDTPYYHITNRCVRSAFLCGLDKTTGKNYAHRRQWIVDQIKLLSEVFTIEVCAYAIMSNHFHLIVHIDEDEAKLLSADDVVVRWIKLTGGSEIARRFRAHEQLDHQEMATLNDKIGEWRKRFGNISEFMKYLDQTIARRANQEDKVTGRFWQGRFDCVALLDEKALLTCMMYVDLNPIRAGMAKSLDTSEFTSIAQRIRAFYVPRDKQKTLERNADNLEVNEQPKLQPFLAVETKDGPPGIPMDFIDYLALTDWASRVVRPNKKGTIPEECPPILSALGLTEDHLIKQFRYYGKNPRGAVGSLDAIKQFSLRMGRRWIQGTNACRNLYQRSDTT